MKRTASSRRVPLERKIAVGLHHARPAEVLATVRKATELFRSTPGRSGRSSRSTTADEVMVVGDLHGNLPAFRKALTRGGPGQATRRGTWSCRSWSTRSTCIDEDRRDRSHQLVDLVSALKCQYPDRVHLILGNHELSELTGRVIGKDGQALNLRFRQGIKTAYGPRTNEIYEAYLDLFAALPLAVRTPNRVFICHTLPDERLPRRSRPGAPEGRSLARRGDASDGGRSTP